MRKEIEVMRVLRVPPMGKLVVEVNNQRYQQLADIREEHFRHLLMAAIGELITFAGGYKELVSAGVAPPLTESREGASSPKTEQERFLANLEAEREAIKSSSSRSQPSILNSIRPKASQPTPEAAGALNLAEQIDAILQRYVAADPALNGRSVRLTQNPAGGLQIEVDGKFYQRPRDIDDRNVQLTIKQALKEWESS